MLQSPAGKNSPKKIVMVLGAAICRAGGDLRLACSRPKRGASPFFGGRLMATFARFPRMNFKAGGRDQRGRPNDRLSAEAISRYGARSGESGWNVSCSLCHWWALVRIRT